MTRQEYLDAIDIELKDTGSFLSTNDKSQALDNAIQQYSKDRPRIRMKEFDGDGSSYDFQLPDDYIGGFSWIVMVEYPAGKQEPRIKREDRYAVYFKNDLYYLRMKYNVPSSSESLRVWYTTLHNEGTIPETDTRLIVKLATSYCFRMLAAKFAQSKDSIIDADIVDYKSKVEQYTALADKLEAEYNRVIGRGDKGHPPAFAIKDWDRSLSEARGHFLYHRPLYR